eukprot:7377472-Prorocentrum_lima.AAC.1
MTSSLVGSEMCIRDRERDDAHHTTMKQHMELLQEQVALAKDTLERERDCLLYTSDAADDM